MRLDKNKKIKLNDTTRWTFRGNVSKLFDEHIVKSVPLYYQTNWLSLEISDFFLKDKSIVYDLGCSTGAFLKALQSRNKSKKMIKYIGIDSVPEMINYAKKFNFAKNIKFEKKDIIKLKLKKSDIIFSFYTLQFIDQKNREKVLKNIYKSLNLGGAFIFSEKILSKYSKNQSMNNDIYSTWKVSQGFSTTQVLNKTKSLRGVLDPNTSDINVEILKKVGFKKIEIITQYLNFQTILAIK